jgi:hypothetical protein
MTQTALLTVHGMGETPRDYAEPLFEAVAARLGPLAAQVDFRSVYYQDILKPNQETVWARVSDSTRLHYADLRRFLLFGFGDAAGLENRKEVDGSVYELAQEAIARPTERFAWINLYDPDDALGWPLQPLSPGYAALVDDRAINAGQGAVSWILKSWNPLSHSAYWGDAQVLDLLTQRLRLEVA